MTGLHNNKESTRVTYTYRVDGHDYEGAVATHDLLAVRDLDAGSRVAVFHDPGNPAISTAVLPREVAKLGPAASPSSLADDR